MSVLLYMYRNMAYFPHQVDQEAMTKMDRYDFFCYCRNIVHIWLDIWELDLLVWCLRVGFVFESWICFICLRCVRLIWVFWHILRCWMYVRLIWIVLRWCWTCLTHLGMYFEMLLDIWVCYGLFEFDLL